MPHVILHAKVYDNATLSDVIERNVTPMGRRVLVSQLGQVSPLISCTIYVREHAQAGMRVRASYAQ